MELAGAVCSAEMRKARGKKIRGLSSTVERLHGEIGRVTGVLALIGVLFAGCGGGGASTREVEDTLQHSLSTLDPMGVPLSRASSQSEQAPPQVKENSCKKIHTGNLRHARIPKGHDRPRGFRRGSRVGRASSRSGRPHFLWPSL